jgi:3'-phosphoadenosine 5'-phosphosulfate (PAPS) 3'-phosphatase
MTHTRFLHGFVLSPSPPLREELEFVLDLVRQCIPVALAYQAGSRGVLGLRHKPDGGGPITAADRDLNGRIVAALADRFGDDAILAEESADDGRWRFARRCWHVDPIDGTREFARGRSGWTIQVGLCVAGRPVLGVVAEPGTHRITWGLVDSGESIALHQLGDAPATPLRVAAARRGLQDLVLIGGKGHPLSRQYAVRRALGVDADHSLSSGSVGVRMTSVARGDADAYVQPPGRAKLWDTCAPEAVLQAAGARVTDLRGRPLSYLGPTVAHPAGVIASSPAMHHTIVDRLAPLAAKWLTG